MVKSAFVIHESSNPMTPRSTTPRSTASRSFIPRSAGPRSMPKLPKGRRRNRIKNISIPSSILATDDNKNNDDDNQHSHQQLPGIYC